MFRKNVTYALLQTLLFSVLLFGKISTNAPQMELADDIVRVSYRNLSLSSVPNNIPLNVTHLDLSVNFISSLPQGAFQTFQNLTYIDLSFNILDRIQDGIFADSVKRVHVAGNNISQIQTNAFSNLDQLAYVNLSRNNLKIWDFAVVFDAANEFVLLDLSFNKIDKIVESNVSFNSLETINVSNNRLTSLNVDSFLGLGAVLDLDISWNLINNIGNHTFSHLSVLENLDLGHNKLVSLIDTWCFGLTSLSTLELGFNDFSEIPTACFPQSFNLQTLILSGNSFTEIRDGNFGNMQSLTHLEISSCDFLVRIDSNAFEPLGNLIELHLDNNPMLENFDSLFGNNTYLSNLEVLVLDSNKKLNKIPASLFLRLENLTKLSLENLELHCDCSLKWLKEEIDKRRPSVISVANTSCLNHLPATSRLLTDVNIDEMVCVAPEIISSSFITRPPNSVSIQVTVSNTGLPWIAWQLPLWQTLILDPETHNVSHGNTTRFVAAREALSTVIITTLSITNLQEDWYGEFFFMASNMAANVSKSFSIDKTSFAPSQDQIARTQLTVALAAVIAVLCIIGLVCLINIQYINKKRGETRLLLDSSDKYSSSETETMRKSMVSNYLNNAQIASSEIEANGEISGYLSGQPHEYNAYQDDVQANTYQNDAYRQKTAASSYDNNAYQEEAIVETYRKHAYECDETDSITLSLASIDFHQSPHEKEFYGQESNDSLQDEHEDRACRRVDDESTKL